MYPFERFNEDAKRTLTLAQEEAERAHHSYIGTEHLLIGLMRVEGGTAYRVLTNLGISLGSVRSTIEAVLGRNERIIIQQIIPTSRVKQVIEFSFGEAQRMGHNSVDTGHLLMGLVIEGDGIAAHVLQDMGATFEKVIPAVERELGSPTSARLKQRGRKRSLFGFPRQGTYGYATSPLIQLGPIPTTDATDLVRLLRRPSIARLLKGKGVDAEALAAQLSEPPPNVVQLRQKLFAARHALDTAIAAQDYEQAARRRDESTDLLKKLEKAEDDWLDSVR